tara:strand:- start:1691 stop:2110 length:420 start_codon:yes stop_codon:yes gene_type:complete
MKVKKEYYRLKGKKSGFDRYHRIPNTPDFPSYNEACDFYRDHCNKGYYMMHIYENISVYKCFNIEDQFVLHLNPPEAILAGSTVCRGTPPKKAEFNPRPFEGDINHEGDFSEEILQTVANSRESTEVARNKVESKPYTL